MDPRTGRTLSQNTFFTKLSPTSLVTLMATHLPAIPAATFAAVAFVATEAAPLARSPSPAVAPRPPRIPPADVVAATVPTVAAVDAHAAPIPLMRAGMPSKNIMLFSFLFFLRIDIMYKHPPSRFSGRRQRIIRHSSFEGLGKVVALS
jgi:hypothetical protein